MPRSPASVRAVPGATAPPTISIVQGMGGMMSVTGHPGGHADQARHRRSPISAPACSPPTPSRPRSSGAIANRRGPVHRCLDARRPDRAADLPGGDLFRDRQVPSLGSATPIRSSLPTTPSPTADGFVNIAVGNDSLWFRSARHSASAGAGRRSALATNARASRIKPAPTRSITARSPAIRPTRSCGDSTA